MVTETKVTKGESMVPVADCSKRVYSDQPKQEWTLSKYLDYLIESRKHTGKFYPSFYLKDWHFQRNFPDYCAYTVPVYFKSDWLNEFWDARGVKDDYRFVYIGAKGTWTPFHADVFHSFSWSANICGRKKWLIFPPGTEDLLRDKQGNLPYDVTASSHLAISALEVIQEAGEIIFVPSGWHHQVHNLEETISINHNWINGCNVDPCWKFIVKNLVDVQKEILDCRSMEGWHDQCQVILKASSGIDYSEFYLFLLTIARERLKLLAIEANKACLKETNIDRGGESQCRIKNTIDSIAMSYNLNTPDLSDISDERQSANVSRLVVLNDSRSDTILSTLCYSLRPTSLNLLSRDKIRRNSTGSIKLVSSENPTEQNIGHPNYYSRLGVNFATPARNDGLSDTVETGIIVNGHSNRILYDISSPKHHAVFDLQCICKVISDMLQNEEFNFIDVSSFDVSPLTLHAEIKDVLSVVC